MTKRPASFDSLPLVLKAEELMPILDIGRNAAYELVNSGQIRGLWVGGQIRILKYDVLAFLERGCDSYNDDLSK